MKIDLLMFRKQRKMTQLEMANMFGISRIKYSEAEKINWIEDRYVYNQLLQGKWEIIPPDDFFDYTSYSLVLNMVVQNYITKDIGGERLTQAKIAEKLCVTQAYVSIILNKFTCLYDRRNQLNRMFKPYFQPFIKVNGKRNTFCRYVSEAGEKPNDVYAKGNEKKCYSILAITYNLRMVNRSRKDLAHYLGINLSDITRCFEKNADMERYQYQLQAYFNERFLVPFYKKEGVYHMVEAGKDVANIVDFPWQVLSESEEMRKNESKKNIGLQDKDR